MAYVRSRGLPQRHGSRSQAHHVISARSLSNVGSSQGVHFDPYARQSEGFQFDYFDQYNDSPTPSYASAISFGACSGGFQGMESPATMFNDPFIMGNVPLGYGNPDTTESPTSNLWSAPRPLTNIKGEPNRLSPPYFLHMDYASLPGLWHPNPNPKGHNRPPCPRCARKGPNFVTRYHPCKGFPCNNCKRKTLKYDGTGGLNAHQCATDRGGTPEHLQKEHKPQRRYPEYPIGGTHWARLKPGDKIPSWKVEHPGVAMEYTQAEMDDVCPGCGGWEWCWCYSDLGEEVDGWALEQEHYRIWAENYQAMQRASGSSSRSQGGNGTGVSQRRSDDARVTKRKPKKSKNEFGTRDEAMAQVHRTKAAKTSRKTSPQSSDLITGLVGAMLKDHYQQKGKQPARPKAAPEKSKAKSGTGNYHLAQAYQWRADLLAKQNVPVTQGDCGSVEADQRADFQFAARELTARQTLGGQGCLETSGAEEQVQSSCKEFASSGTAKRVRFSPAAAH